MAARILDWKDDGVKKYRQERKWNQRRKRFVNQSKVKKVDTNS